MRLKSEIWVHAFLRQAEANGAMGAVLFKGAAEAGAVFVVVNRLDGSYELYEPPPGPAYDEQGERLFIRAKVADPSWHGVRAILERRRRSDPDLWCIELELRTGDAGLKLASA